MALPLAAAQAALVKPETQGRLTNRYTQDNWGALEDKRLSTYFQMGIRNIFWDKLSTDLSLRNDVRAEGKGTKFQENFLSIYTANVALEKLPGGFSTRLGRQYYYGAETTVNFDGVNVEWQKLRWLQTGVMAGNPTKQAGEAVGRLFQGAFVKLMRGYNAHIRAGVLRVLHSSGFKADDDVELSVYRRYTSIVTLRGRASVLNGSPKNAFVTAQFQKIPWGLTVSPSYYKHLFVVDPAALMSLSPYARTFAHYERYDRAGLEVTKMLGPHLSLTGGGDEYFPRRRQRFSLGLSGWDFLWKGTDFSLFGVQNVSERNDNFSFTGTLGYRPNVKFEFSAGASFNTDIAETYYGRRTTKSRTYFGSFKFAPRKSFDIVLSPSVTEASDSSNRMYRMELRNNWRF